YQAMRAAALAQAGRTTEAAEQFDGIVDKFSSPDMNGMIGAEPMLIRHLSEICRQLGDSDRASIMLAQITPWAGQILVSDWGLSTDGASDPAIGPLLATLGRLDEADTAYNAAADLERSAGFSPLVARTEYWHAQALLERGATGDRDRARALLDDVIGHAD